MTTPTQLGRSVNRRRQALSDLVLTPKLSEYFENNEEPVFSPWVAAILLEVLLGKRRDARPGRLGPSARGMCLRRQTFSYLGVPQHKHNASLSWVFFQGVEKHLMLQGVTLELGLTYDIESPIKVPKLRSSGRLDARGIDVHGKEFAVDIKTSQLSEHQLVEIVMKIHDVLEGRSNFPEKTDLRFYRVWKTFLQVASYMLMSDFTDKPIEYFSLLYLHKGQSDRVPFQEIIVQRNPTLLALVDTELAALNTYIGRKELPPMLRGCEHDPDGTAEWKDCPYRFVCEDATWPARTDPITTIDPPNLGQPVKLKLRRKAAS